jgi:glycosyltransferase involved in cell wall biosynthesis
MKIALVHDWLTNFAGAERVLLALHEIWPEAPIYTTVFNKKNMPQFSQADVRVSFLQKIPWAKKRHQLFLPLMPIAFESFDFSEYDVVLSTSHACSKGIVTKPKTLHICYCHTPMRYAWDDSQSYIRNSGFSKLFKKWLIPVMMNYLRVWDRAAADRVDKFLANSNFVAQRIKKYYQREAKVIYPPVETDRFKIAEPLDYYLMVGRLVPYKRADLVVEAFNKNGRKIFIAGEGPEKEKLQKIAKENIIFLGRISESQVENLMSRARAFIFPQEEDFGISAVEAQAAGRPVIAYKGGGALETIIEGKTGIFFEEQTAESLNLAIERADKIIFFPEEIRAHAKQFDVSVFKNRIKQLIEQK